MLSLPTVAAWWAGSDYLRMTSKEARNADLATVYKRAAYAVVGATTEGVVDFEPWGWKGYYGERCGSVSYGSGAQGHILQVAGWQAQEELLWTVPHDNIPRWDVQLTLWFAADIPFVAQQIAWESSAARQEVDSRPWRVALIEGFGNGDTTYLGSRSSDKFIRVYDKWRESGEAQEWEHSWRFEVELKDGAANANWPEPGAPSPGPHWAAAIVLAALRTRGIDLSGAVEIPPVPLALTPAKATTTESRLAWLRNQVKPSIDKLLAAGVSYSRVLEELGLDGADRG